MFRTTKCLGLAVILFIAGFPGFVTGESADAAYQKYVTAYREYQKAVAAQRPAAEIDRIRRTYVSAKDAYVAVLPGKSAKISQSALSSVSLDSTPTTIPTSLSVSDLSNGIEPVSIPAQISPEIDPATFSSDVQVMIDSLNSKSAGSYSDAIISQIKDFLVANPSHPDRNKIKYELAKAYERLKQDQASAIALYKEIAADPDSGCWGSYASRRVKYLNASVDSAKWKKVLLQRFADMNSAYNKYKATSWLAFPVKMDLYVKYVSTLRSFVKAQNDESDFQLWYEALGAPFALPPEEFFDKYTEKVDPKTIDESVNVKLVYDNYKSWFTRWKLIDSAKSSIDMTYFIVEDDIFGISLLGLCMKKAAEGVRVRLMVDARGSIKLGFSLWSQDYLQELVGRGNLEIKVYNPIEVNLASILTDWRRMLTSNHDKIIVIDGRQSIIGGRNIADEYLIDPIDNADAWRDCDVVIDSEVLASKLETAFIEEFELLKVFEVASSSLGGTRLRGLEMEAARHSMESALNGGTLLDPQKVSDDISSAVTKYNSELTKLKHMTGYPQFEPFEGAYVAPVQILDKNSLLGPRNDITDSIIQLIDGCQKEIIIQNPYVVLTPRAEAALKRASKRGIPIYFHMNSPETSDVSPAEAMFLRDWRTFLKEMPTCRFFARVNEGLVHAKNFVFDAKVGIVGTYNFDYLSEKWNSEVVAMIKSPEFSAELRKEIFFDMSKAKEYHLATADSPEFGPEDIEGAKQLWLLKLLSKMGWLNPLF